MDNPEDWRLPGEWAPTKRPKSKHKGDLFAKLWLWHLHLLLEKHASGGVFRLFFVLVHEDFKSFGRAFTVTSEMVGDAGIDRKSKAGILRLFEQWGLIFLEQRTKKNPRVFLRKLQGRGQDPFANCR
jgi:hypothetical protein